MRVTRSRLVLGLALALAVGPPAELRGQAQLRDAEAALRGGRYEDAISAFAALNRRAPESTRAARGYARALMQVGRYEQAEAVARRVLERTGTAELWNTLGEILWVQGRRDGAEDAFGRAVSEGAGDALEARLNLAILTHRRGETEAAAEMFDGFIDVYNSGRDLSAAELATVATAVRYLGRHDPPLFKDALRAYDEAIAADPTALEPRVQVGELFLEKYNSGDAAAAFADVLEVNPSHPRALLGEARRLRFDGQPGAAELVRRALEVNPSLVPARVLLARLHIDLEDYPAAAREARRALEVNPASLEALAVLAATGYLGGDAEVYERARQRALELNPRYAGLYTELAELCTRTRLYGRAVDFARRAVRLDGSSWRGFALLGVNQLRTGAIAEGRRNLEIAFEGDPYDVRTKNTLDLLDTFASYEETNTGRFVLAVDGRESPLLSLYLGDLAERAYTQLADRYDFRPQTPIRVELYRNHADFSVRTAGLVGFDALGVSFGPVIAMDAPSAREPGSFHWGSTFWHELAHSFHLGLSDHRVPRWFSEGLAVLEQRQAQPGWGIGVTPDFLLAYRQDRLLLVHELNNGFARPSYPEQLVHSYYQASLVCELIEREAGWKALVRMLQAYRDGSTTDEVFREVLGSGVDEFNRRFFDYLERRFAVPLAALRPERERPHGGRPPGKELGRLAREDPGDFLAQLSYGRQLFQEGDTAAARRHLERAKSLFPSYAGPGNPYWHLAQLHKRQGALGQAVAELAELARLNAEDQRAALELAELRVEMGDIRGAATALERAVMIYPYDADTHTRLAELYRKLGEHEGEIRERQAVLALEPVDRAEAFYRLAQAYFAAGRYAEARRAVLRALERAPRFEEAQELLLEIRARSQAEAERGGRP